MRFYGGYIGLIGRLPIPLVSPESLKAGPSTCSVCIYPTYENGSGSRGALILGFLVPRYLIPN